MHEDHVIAGDHYIVEGKLDGIAGSTEYRWSLLCPCHTRGKNKNPRETSSESFPRPYF